MSKAPYIFLAFLSVLIISSLCRVIEGSRLKRDPKTASGAIFSQDLHPYRLPREITTAPGGDHGGGAIKFFKTRRREEKEKEKEATLQESRSDVDSDSGYGSVHISAARLQSAQSDETPSVHLSRVSPTGWATRLDIVN